jgi:cobalt-zinc-cadmium resistance protein CzcA
VSRRRRPAPGGGRQNDDDDIVNGMVLMRKGENPRSCSRPSRARIEEINRTQLPPGVRIEPFYDRSWLIGSTLNTVFTNLLEGAMLVGVVLYLFLKNMRAAAIVAALIPLSLLAHLPRPDLDRHPGEPAVARRDGLRHHRRRRGDRRREHLPAARRQLPDAGRPQGRAREAVLDAAVEVGRPTLFSMLIIIAAHIPIFTLQRHEGRIFAPMAYSVVSALVGSLILSLTLVPLLCAGRCARGLARGQRGMVRLEQARLRARAAPGAAARRTSPRVALARWRSPRRGRRAGQEFLPELNEGSVWVNVTLRTQRRDPRRSARRAHPRVVQAHGPVSEVAS